MIWPLTTVVSMCCLSTQAYDQKNIRRRVYDALNVLMAMNIISKEKKEIRWIGLPTNSAQECHSLEVNIQRGSKITGHLIFPHVNIQLSVE